MNDVRRMTMAAALLLLAACAGENGATARPVSVRISLTPTTPRPDSLVEVVVTATPEPGDRLAFVRVIVSGVLVEKDSIPVSADGPATLTSHFLMPRAKGGVRFVGSTATTGGSTGSVESSATLVDGVPPTLLVESVRSPHGASAEPGDTIGIFFRASDDVGVVYTAIRAAGAFTKTDSVARSAAQNVSDAQGVVVPRSALGQSFTLTLETMDIGGNLVKTTLGTYPVRDLTPPHLAASLSGNRTGVSFAPADTIRFALSATDNVALDYVGYVLGAPLSVRDSVKTSGATFDRTFALPIGGRTGTVPITLFAGDSIGNRAEVSLGFVTIGTRARRPLVSSPLRGGLDVAYDDKRARLYVSQPDSGSIAILSADGSSRIGTIPLPSRPLGLDITRGGDSLVVALDATTGVGVVDLRTMATSTHAVLLPFFDPDTGIPAESVRISSNGRAVIGLRYQTIEFDLATRTPMRVFPMSDRTPIAASGNRERIYALRDDECCPASAVYYDGPASRFSSARPVVNYNPAGIATDYSGNAVLVGDNFLTGDMTFIRTLAGGVAQPDVGALSSDGAFAFLPTLAGLVKVRTATNVVEERIDLGHRPVHMRMSSDGFTLVVLSATMIDVIDLW